MQVVNTGNYGPRPMEIIIQKIIANSYLDKEYHFVGPYEFLRKAKDPLVYPIITATTDRYGFSFKDMETYVTANVSIVFEKPKEVLCEVPDLQKNEYAHDNYITYLVEFQVKALTEIAAWLLGYRMMPDGKPLVEFEETNINSKIQVYANRELGESLRDQAEIERKLSEDDLVVVEMIIPMRTCMWDHYCNIFTPEYLENCEEC